MNTFRGLFLFRHPLPPPPPHMKVFDVCGRVLMRGRCYGGYTMYTLSGAYMSPDYMTDLLLPPDMSWLFAQIERVTCYWPVLPELDFWDKKMTRCTTR